MDFKHQSDLLGTFAHHRVAANLLMVMMILAGLWGLAKLNTQFFPNFALDFVNARVTWTGATAEDVENSITVPIEQELRSLDGLREMTSSSTEGVSTITIEYDEGTDMGVALDQVKERVSLVRNLPIRADEPEVTKLVRYEPIARVLVTTREDLRGIRVLVHSLERELLDRGIAKVAVTGLPAEEIAIQVSTAALRDLNLSLADIANRIAGLSRDMPAGTIGRDEAARQLRALEQMRTETEFSALPLVSDSTGRLVRLGEVATIERRPRSGATRLLFKGNPAVELSLLRTENSDTLKAARILKQWIEDTKPVLPPGVELHVFEEGWTLIKQRIELLLRNGAGGLVLVVLILFLFMNGRVAFWVAVGIPVSFMATLGVLYLAGGSINMLSLFAMIMTLGIIVDDAIVVGEDALAHYEAGEHPLQAAEGGARRMFAPVMSSSLTTVAAFLPLMMVSGIIGNILFDIPLVVICVIAASLVESFLVLPGHLRGSFNRIHHRPPTAIRAVLDKAFNKFREGLFRPVVRWTVNNPATLISLAFALLALALGLLAGGRLAFNFFPSPEGTIIHSNIGFVAGTPAARVERFLLHVEDKLLETEESFGESLVDTAVVRLGSAVSADERSVRRGDQYGSIRVELTEPDTRSVRNLEFINRWQASVILPPGIETFSVFELKPGPPGRDIDVRLHGTQAATLKAAALELAETLSTVPGVISVEDQLPFGPEQLIYSLTPLGETLGLTVESVGQQLRAAYDGHIAQIYQDGDDELEVRVVLPEAERNVLSSLDTLGIVLPSGITVPLPSVVMFDVRRGFQSLTHTDGRLSVQVAADVDPALGNTNEIIDIITQSNLPELAKKHGIEYSFEGRNADQSETLADMRRGGLLALAMIYLVLAWVFASYGWPLVVMMAIPFGLIGALTGHWMMGIELTILSLFGIFGLSGIVVNDSIILITFYKRLREQGMEMMEAIVEAACQRLRAVLLTSLTTIAGLLPLLFETSLQAQFLIPMAVSISFGLAFATVLVLLVVPAMLTVHEHVADRFQSPLEPQFDQTQKT